MVSPMIRHARVPAVAAVLALLGACATQPPPVVELSSGERARIDRKLTRGPERFGDPDLAEQFYVNSRTGPIITRGPNVTTGVRQISPEAYLPALAQMRPTRVISPSHKASARLTE